MWFWCFILLLFLVFFVIAAVKIALEVIAIQRGLMGQVLLKKTWVFFFLQRVVVVKCGIHVTFLELKNF